VALHGSKIPHLLLYVQQLCEDDNSRIIIFSQWTRLLMLIGNLLEEHGVRTLFCRGTAAHSSPTFPNLGPTLQRKGVINN
jgi:SNF2 family DNA or RNA helicase